MPDEITKWVDLFQGLILTRFRQTKTEAIEVLTRLIVGHLFGLYNLNQLSHALRQVGVGIIPPSEPMES